MKASRWLFISLMLWFGAVAGRADTISFTGSLAGPSSVSTTSLFTLLTTSDVTLQTLSFGGGTNAAGQVIPGSTIDAATGFPVPAGFEPDLAVFGPGPGNPLLGFTAGVRSSCPPANPDNNFGGICGDTTLALAELAPGSYIIAVMALGNTPGATLASSFSGGGSFVGAQGELRQSNFAVDATITPSSVPEPGTLFTLLFGLSALGLRKSRARG
jgi:PEP-CTERM motif-containing protein